MSTLSPPIPPALAQFRKIRASALEELNKAKAPALAEFNDRMRAPLARYYDRVRVAALLAGLPVGVK